MDAATLLLLGGQIVFSIFWAANIVNRVGVLETRGSIQAEKCLSSVEMLKERLELLAKELDKHERQPK